MNISSWLFGSNDTILKNNYSENPMKSVNDFEHKKFLDESRVIGVNDKKLCNKAKKTEDFASHFAAGVAAGVAEWFVGHPLDTIRVRIMAGPGANGIPVAGTFAQLSTGFRSWEGITALYRGSTSELLASALGGSLLFGVNNILKRLFAVGPREEGLTWGLLLAATGTGVIDSTIYKPLEIIKLRQQVRDL